MIRFQYVVIYWLPVVGYCLFIFVLSSFSYPESIPIFPHSDKLAHFLIYSVLGALFLRAFSALRFNNRRVMLILFSIAAATFYGVSDEFHQLFVPYREASIMDIAADAIGSAFGVFLYSQIAK